MPAPTISPRKVAAQRLATPVRMSDPAAVRQRDVAFVHEAMGKIKAADMANDAALFLDEATVRTDASNPGWVTLYRTSGPTRGHAVEVLAAHVYDHLRKTLPDGSPAFVANPELAPKPIKRVGLCFLHPDYEDAETVESLAFGVTCTKSNLPPGKEGEAHMRVAHKSAWTGYQEALKEKEAAKAENRAQANTEALTAALTGNKA